MPKIELSSIPGLESAQALFGAISDFAAGPGDDIVEIMIYLYDSSPPPPPYNHPCNN